MWPAESEAVPSVQRLKTTKAGVGNFNEGVGCRGREARRETAGNHEIVSAGETSGSFTPEVRTWRSFVRGNRRRKESGTKESANSSREE